MVNFLGYFGFGIWHICHVDRHGHFTLKQLRLSLVNETHTKPYTVPRLNGTNFRGAEAEVKPMLQNWNQAKILDRLRKKKIQWHFSAPSASHTE